MAAPCPYIMYYVLYIYFHVAHKIIPVSCIHFIVILFKSYCKGDDPDTMKTNILLQFDHLVSSMQFAT